MAEFTRLLKKFSVSTRKTGRGVYAVMYTSPNVKRRLAVLASAEGWTMSSTMHLAVQIGLRELENEKKIGR